MSLTGRNAINPLFPTISFLFVYLHLTSTPVPVFVLRKMESKSVVTTVFIALVLDLLGMSLASASTLRPEAHTDVSVI